MVNLVRPNVVRLPGFCRYAIDNIGKSVFETKNGGETWKEYQYSSSTIPKINVSDIFFIDDLTGFMVSDFGLFLITKDGGETWKAYYEAITLSDLNSLTQIDSNKIFIAGDQGIGLMMDVNGWEEISLPTKEDLTSVDFSSENVGVITGKDGSVFLTEDSGNNWKKIQSYNLQLNDLVFKDSTGLFCGNDGTIYRSDNGGLSWIDISYSNTDLDIISCEIVSKDTLIAVGSVQVGWDLPWYSCIFLKSVDKGKTWNGLTLHQENNPINIYLIKKLPSGDLITSIHHYTAKSEANGESWTTLTLDDGIKAISIKNPNQIYGISETGKLIESTDEGDTWISKQSFQSAENWGGITDFMVTKNCTYIIGNKGMILGTSDIINSSKKESIIKTLIIPESISIASSDSETLVYPNPTNEFLNIESTKPFKNLSIYSLLGQLITSIQNNCKVIDVSYLSPGLYILKIDFSNGPSKQIKFIVK